MIQESLITFLGEIHHWDIIHSNSFWARNEKCLKPRGFKQNIQRQLLGPVEEEKGGLYCSPGLRVEKGVKRWELPFESRFPGRGWACTGPCSEVRCPPSAARPFPGERWAGGCPGDRGLWGSEEKGQMYPRMCGHVGVHVRVCPQKAMRQVEMAALENACKYTLFWKTLANTHFSQQQKWAILFKKIKQTKVWKVSNVFCIKPTCNTISVNRVPFFVGRIRGFG